MMTPLQKIMAKTGRKQREVASANGIDEGQFSRILRGKENITPENAEKISRYFGHQISELELLFPSRYVTVLDDQKVEDNGEAA